MKNDRKQKYNKRPNKKGYKPQTNHEVCEDKDRSKEKGQDYSNDPSWYSADPSLLRDAASIPFSWAVGTPITLNGSISYVVPGIMTLTVVPTCGYSTDWTSPINVAANATYTFVRHANSGHANYDAPDLMLYIYGTSQIYSYINFLQRAYGLATLYTQRNRYVPKALLQANCIDADDVAAHLADFRYGINVLINKAASLAVPNNMPIFNRQAFLYANVYTEGASVKDQLYMYVPGTFLTYVETEGAGKLVHKKFTTQTVGERFQFGANDMYTVEQLLQYGNEIIDPIIGSEDMNIMSGDILKAYGINGIMKLVSLPEIYPIVPVFSITVLEQFKNATMWKMVSGSSPYWSPIPDDNANITQAPNGAIITQPLAYPIYTLNTKDAQAGIFFNRMAENKILSTTASDPGPEIVIENTRLMSVLGEDRPIPGQVVNPKAVYSGSEFCTACTIYQINPGSSTVAPRVEYFSFTSEIIFDYNAGGSEYIGEETFEMFTNILLMNAFKFCPLTHIFNISYANALPTTERNTYDSKIYGDVDNYAVLTSEDVKRMHEAAVMNMLHVPSIGKLM